MLGINTTGKPDVRDYHLGRGCVFLSEIDTATGKPVECYRDLGNTPSASISVDVEELTHRASLCGGAAQVDRRLIIQRTMTVSLTLEELNHDNVALFFSATVDSPANPAVAGIASFSLTTALATECWYPLQTVGGVRALGITEANLTVTDVTGAPVVLVGGDDDFKVDEKMGMIFFNAGGTNGLIGDGTEAIDVVLAADAGAPATIERVNALKQTEKEYAVKLVIENANNANEQVEMEFHKASVAADGELSLIGDELAQLGLSFVAQQNALLPGSPTLTISKAVG